MAARTLKASAALSKLLGKTEITRTEAVKDLWAYIKTHKLQDATTKSMIRADSALKEAFGVDSFTQTQVMGLLSKHLTKTEEPAAKKMQ